MNSQMMEYLKDPFLARMFNEVRKTGPLKSILVDITHICNLRCVGCYFFTEGMDQYKAPKDEAAFDEFIAREKARGTNYVTVVGGEPTIVLHRVKKFYDNFCVLCVTNGLRPIPYEGFEDMAIAISLWGDHETDIRLRGRGKLDVFARALENFKDDPRALWFYTTTTGNAHEIQSVVEQCVDNGNYVGFNFYVDTTDLGGDVDNDRGFAAVRREIDRAIERFPDRIMCSSYINEVVSSRKLYGEEWSYDVCSTITYDHPLNQDRVANGNPTNTHFRAYTPDLETTRRCCVGEADHCEHCFHLWSYMSWIMLSLDKHLGSKQEFTNWLTTMYLYYLSSRAVDFESGVKLLPEIHRRTSPQARAAVRASVVPAQAAAPALHLGA